MKRRRTQSALTRGGAALTAAIAISAAASQPVQANDVVDEIGHFIACFGWMLTDPATHVANCNPGAPDVRFESLASAASPSGPAALEGPTGEEEEPGGSGSGGSGSGSGGSGTGGSEEEEQED